MKERLVMIILLEGLLCTAYDVQRSTDLGPVGGRRIQILGTTIEEYRGIPFAEPPVGELRFKPPVPAKTWDGILNATSRTNGCPQPLESIPSTADVGYSEDCLHLNVWAREGTSDAPVLVWIYGGGFTYGTASDDSYTGAVIAAKTGIVVASMNYRLGVLGFLNAASPESPGNMGLLDQNLALKWIKNNIQHFGGDPSHITLIGESAGGMSAHAHMLSPMSRGLFQRVIAMSGVINAPDMTDTAHESLAKGDALAAVVGCLPDNKTLSSHPDDVIGCLRTRSADELVRAQFQATPGKHLPFQPTFHDAFLPEEPSVAVRSGSFDVSVKLLTGVTRDEGAVLVVWNQPNPEILAEQLDNVDREKLKHALFETLSLWLKNVPSSLLEDDVVQATNKSAIRRKFVAYLGDRLFVCPMHIAAAAHASRGGQVNTYVFDHWRAKTPRSSWMGVGHSMDLPFIFGLPLLDPDHVEFADADVAASEKLLTMIGAFAGLPAHPGVAAWPTYTADSPISILVKNDEDTTINGFRSEHCATSSNHL